jgi:S1-C subfamily serine protease
LNDEAHLRGNWNVSIMHCSVAWLVRRVLVVVLPLSLVLLAAHADAVPDTVAVIVAAVSPAVVRLVTVRPLPHEKDDPARKLEYALTNTAFGSGYIIDPSGYIGTNKHVVDCGIAVFVVAAEGVRHPAQTAGAPEQADIALIKIDPGRKKLPFVRFCDSDRVHHGNKVIAIGSLSASTTLRSPALSARSTATSWKARSRL